MEDVKVNIPEGVSGAWSVKRFTVSPADSAMTAIRVRRGEYVPAGDYTKLMRGSVVVMSDTLMEAQTNREFMTKAKGDVLINGLGIGMVLSYILKNNDIKSVTVVEKSEDVINLVGPTFEDDPRVTIINADAFEYKPTGKFDYVWHDIWDYITADNIPEMSKLHRKYGRRAEWQGSWARAECEYERTRHENESRGLGFCFR